MLLATKAGTKQEACRRVLHKLINLPLVRNHTDPPQLQHGLFIAETKNAQHFYHAFFFFFATVKLQLLVLPVLKLTFTTLTPHLQQESVVVPDLLTLLRTAKRIFMPNTLCIYGIVYISNVFLVHNGSDESTENTFPPLCSQHFTVSKDFTFSLSTSINVTYN